ncbi:MAG: radical SAM protein [Gemmatimonadota bacterium]|nr:radical SAM protein [Gemmatimonadota bacterium]
MSTDVLTNKQAILDECAKASLRVDHLPYYYEVHLAMPCNEKCIMCVPDGKHKRDQISLEEFTAFFDQIKPVAEHLTLIGGETFMYPWFNEVLDLLAQHPITVTIITNATMLTEKISPRLLALHALELKCSVDAATRETYFRIRGRDVFDKVIANVTRFSQQTREMPNIRRILVYVVMRENLGEVLPFVDLARRLDVHRVYFQPVKHVRTWKVTNGTGWLFDGSLQSCESFREEYNDVMLQAREKCALLGLGHDITLL